MAQQLATAQSSVRAARAGADAAVEEARALQNMLRGKDRELQRLDKIVGLGAASIKQQSNRSMGAVAAE